MVEGVDYAFTTVSESALFAAGKRFAMRYVGPGSSTKHLTAAERDRIWAAGMDIVLLAEGAADSALGGYNTGVAHGEQARDAAEALGAPQDRPIYAAVDFDVTASQWSLVAQYLRGFGFGVGSPQVGVYGSFRAVQWAARDNVADWFFQTYAWSGGAWFASNHVEQYRNGVQLAGGEVDLCRAKVSNFGQWTRAGIAPVATEEESMRYTFAADVPGTPAAVVGRVHVTNGLEYFIQESAFQYAALGSLARGEDVKAPRIINVTKGSIPPGHDYARAVRQLCGRQVADPSAPVTITTTPGPLTISLTGTATPWAAA